MSSLRLAFIGVVLAGLAACANEPTAIRSAPSLAARAAAGGGGRVLVTSGARYSDRGVKPATGRSGSAAIAAEAVFSGSGITDLTVTPYRASDLSFATPVGCIEKVQLKAFGADGRPLWTRNYVGLGLTGGAAFTVPFIGLMPGSTLQVQANVKCVDPRRTDVVTVTVRVVRRTDPAVTALTVPSAVPIASPVLVLAKVQELHGDQGATGTCYLSVDDELTDSIPRVWVDAGGSVDCAFAPTFYAEGEHTVRVDFANVVPLDDDPTNNSRSATLTVSTTPPPPPPNLLQPWMITATVYDDTVDTWDQFWYSQRSALNPTVLFDTMYTQLARQGNDQYAGFYGIIYSSLTFPLARLSVSQRSGATTYHAFSGTDLPAVGAPSYGVIGCADESSAEVYLMVCSYEADDWFPYGMTTVDYVRETSNAAYVSQQYYVAYTGGVPSACDPASTDVGAACYYVTRPLGAPMVPYGSSYVFSVVIETASRRYSAAVNLPLLSAPIPVEVPFHCGDMTYTGWGNVPILYHACASYTGTLTRKSGDMPSLVGLTEEITN